MAPRRTRADRNVVVVQSCSPSKIFTTPTHQEQVVTASVSFDVQAGEIVSIVGPSGCGKTTLLKALAGLLKPTGGTIRFQGKVVQGVPDGLAMVFPGVRPLLAAMGNSEREHRTSPSIPANLS